MSRTQALLSWLEDKSDWLSPIVVKEVRQVVSGREFAYSFGASLVAGLAIAFMGAADALTGNGTAGSWTFYALMGCLAFLGLAVVPLGAFSALRNERMEQTLELITLTELSPRRVVVGKLLAQGVKLTTLFAAVAPFVAMSFLLGGIDFLTILLSLVVLLMWSLWASAVCLFLSTLLKSRALSGLAFGAAAIVVLLVFGLLRSLYMLTSRALIGPGVGMGAGPDLWWVLAVATLACVVTMGNLVLLAENRLALPTENRVTSLRVGFLVQLLLIVGIMLTFLGESPRVQSNAIEALSVIGGLHLALVALFAVTEDLVVPRRALRRMAADRSRAWLLAMFRPGGGRGALYVIVQIALLLGAAALLGPEPDQWRWLLSICGYICFFSGAPTFAFRFLFPDRAASFKLRVAILLVVAGATVLPDVIYYLIAQPEFLDLRYSMRHLTGPFRTLANWRLVEERDWTFVPLALGAVGFLCYVLLIQVGARVTQESAEVEPAGSAAAGEADSASVY